MNLYFIAMVGLLMSLLLVRGRNSKFSILLKQVRGFAVADTGRPSTVYVKGDGKVRSQLFVFKNESKKYDTTNINKFYFLISNFLDYDIHLSTLQYPFPGKSFLLKTVPAHLVPEPTTNRARYL